MAQLSGLLRSAFAQPDLHAVRDADLRTGGDARPARRRARRRCARSSPPRAGARTAPCSSSPPPTARPKTSARAAADLIDAHTVAVLPSWETLPHERLSPRPDTVGRRLTLFRRLATDDAPRVLVAAARSLIQPIAPGLGALEPVRLRVGDTHDFDALLVRLVELAYTRVEMVTARGEFAVRGGIVDIFPPTAEHPVRVEFWGDEVSELRAFTVADQRSTHPVDELDAPGCRELLLTDPVRERAAALARTHENNPPLRELLEHLAQGIPTEGMESLIPALVGAELQLLTDLLPDGALGARRRPGAGAHPQRRPRAHRPGVPGGQLVRRGHGRRRPDRRRRVGLPRPRRRARARHGHRPPGRHAQPAALAAATTRSSRAPTRSRPTTATSTARSSTSAPTSPPAAPPCSCSAATAPRSARWSSSATPRCPRCWPTSSPDEPEKGLVTVTCGRIVEGFTAGAARGAHRGRPHRQPRRDHRDPQARLAPSQRRRPGHAQARRLRRARPARHRPLRRDAPAHGAGRHPRVPGAGVRVVQARPARRPPLRAHRRARRGEPLRRRRGAHAQQARRRRLGEDQGPRAQGRPADRGPARAALRRAPGRARLRVRQGHPVAARAGGRVPLHRDARPAVRDRRGQGGHGAPGPDGPGDLRRRRLRQDRDRRAGRVQGRAGRQAGGGARADHAARHPAPGHVRRADARVPRRP